jgi:endonuclease/exonuclease/phosphatase family metal-dependent hydrolase
MRVVRTYKIAASLIIATLLSACTVSKVTTFQTFQPKLSGEIRVATYNLNWGEKDWREHNVDNISHAIQVVNADIIFLQEASFEWEKIITDDFSKRYRYRQFFHFYNDSLGRGMAILSKYPIESKKYIYAYSGWYPGWHGYIRTPIAKIQFLSVRLLPIQYDENDLSSMPFYSMFSSSTKRKKDFLGYYLKLDPYLPTLIAGDFNETNDGLTVNFLRKHGYSDTSLLFKKPTYTWHWPLKIVTLANQLDYIFYTPHHLHAVRAQVLHEGGSDHYPVVVDFVK